MASIFNALNIGYGALNAAQVAIDTTGHNISNAETEGYTRQRVVTAAATPSSIDPGQRGNGTQIIEIARVFDQFVYNRYTSASQNKEYSDTLKKNLEELSTYFPEIDKMGIKNDLQNYFNSWQSLASSPNNSALKVALVQQTQTLVLHINETRSQITALQGSLNDQIKVNIDEVNRIAEQIAGLNKSINEAETGGINNANDLRDQRNKLEMTLSKLLGSKVTSGKIESKNTIDSNIAESDGNYTIQVGGFNLVDGSTFHPFGIDNKSSKYGYNDIYYERQDGVRIPLTSNISSGKIGALIELRGAIIGDNGEFEDGFLQETINNLDTFAHSLIESSNSIYAQSAVSSMRSNPLSISSSEALVNTESSIRSGSFNMIVYDINGKKVSERLINIDASTVMQDSPLSMNSVLGQLNSVVNNHDDNSDNNAINDIDDMIQATFTSNILEISFKSAYSTGYTLAIEDNGTNFAGATGLNRFFDGTSAKDISINSDIKEDPTLLRGFKSPEAGDNQTALDMVELQFSNVTFEEGIVDSSDTLYGYFDRLVTNVGTKTNSAILASDSITAQYNAVKQEYESVSKVSIDEEMANLIRYQTSYGAAAKIITTIDQMMTTLLGIKQ